MNYGLETENWLDDFRGWFSGLAVAGCFDDKICNQIKAVFDFPSQSARELLLLLGLFLSSNFMQIPQRPCGKHVMRVSNVYKRPRNRFSGCLVDFLGDCFTFYKDRFAISNCK